jgi:hypothetical protein
MASNKLTPALKSDVGTSFSAPRIAHHLAVIAHELRQINVEPSSALLRALLATSSDSPNHTHSWCETTLGSCEAALSVIGHGLPSGIRALECSRSSVTLHYQGSLEVGKVALFQIPVPIDLADVGRGIKKIIVSVATTPSVQKWGLTDYLGAELRFRLFRGDENPTDVSAFMALEVGSTQIRPNVGDQSGELGITARSNGTLQRECFIWKQHSREYSAHPYTLAIALTPSQWLDSGEFVPVAVAVRIEDETGVCNTLYASVRASVTAEVQAQA